MPLIPFPNGFEASEGLPHTRRSLVNCFNTGNGQIISRPGITSLNTTGKVARGQFVWNDNLYQVVSGDLIKITDTETGAFSFIDSIAGSNPVVTAIGFNHAVILVPGGTIYTLDASDVLAVISGNSNFVPCDAVAHINGRFVYIPTSGDPAFFSDVGAAGTVQVLSFFDAEELPDKNSTVFNLNNTLYIGGTDSIELFRDTGASPNPFGRVTGARISYGYIGGLLEYGDTFIFLGREKDQNFGVYALSQGSAVKISNEAIDVVLATYLQSELADAFGARFKWRGYDIAVLALARDTFGFRNGNWFVLDTINNGTPTLWGGGFITQFEGTYYTASGVNIGKLAAVNTDYGDPVRRVIDIGFEQEYNDFFTCQSLGLDASQGHKSGAGTIGLFTSRDNVLYGPGIYRDVGEIGEYDKHLEWNEMGGLGTFDGFMGIRLKTLQDVDFATEKMFANFR